MLHMSFSPPRQLANLGSFKPPVENDFTKGAGTDRGALTNLETIISNVIGLMTVLAGLFFLFQFLSAALSWVTSGGEKGKLESARTQMLNATIGLVLVVASYAIIGLIGRVVGIDILQPAAQLQKVIPSSTGVTP
jgi:hypothetical protein